MRQSLFARFENQDVIIIGSAAMDHWFLNFREPKDIDIVVKEIPDNHHEAGIEYHVIPPLWEYFPEDGRIHADIDMLYTLKCSHIFWDIHWYKTIHDIQYLQDKGARIIEGLFPKLFDYWEIKHGRRRTPNFTANAAEFFDNTVNCPLDHEYLHERFAFYDKPLYHQILKDGAEVETDEGKFNALSKDLQLKIVHEECGNLAFERWRDIHPKAAFFRALRRMIIDLTPLWLAKFIVENYNQIKPTDKFYSTWKELKSEIV